MKTVVFVAALAVVGLVVTGAIKLQKAPDNNTLSIQIDKERVREDAERVVDEGKEVLRETENSLNQATSH